MNKKAKGLKTIVIREVLWQRLKIIAARNSMSLQDATDQALIHGLKYANPTKGTKDNGN